MKKIMCLTFFLVFKFMSIAQNEDAILPFSNPVAPNAFEFIKYGEVPVSQYTGIPNIDIPIYTIDSKGLQLPINLSYHSGGFKVSEESGSTGLGWTLNAGGTITQIVNGFDDFGPQKSRDNEFESMYTALHNGPVLDIDNCGPALSWQITQGSGNGTPTGVSEYPYWNPLNMSGIKDLEPDVFKFNFLGYSGEFALNWETEEFVCLNNPKIKIEGLVFGSIYHFKITTPEGHTLTFNVVEETEIDYIDNAYQDGLNLLGNITSRHYKLGNIVTNLGEVITFNYDQINSEVHNLPSLTEIQMGVRREYTCQGGYGTEGVCSNGASGTGPIQKETRTKQNQSFYLNEILFSNGKIEFENSASRLDINNTMKLDRINIKSGEQLLSSFDLDYGYFIGSYVPSYINSAGNTSYSEWDNFTAGDLVQTETELSHRLKLNSIKESGKPSYTFSYYDEDKFFKKTVKSNLWGFNSDTSRLKAGILQSITYPTGGNTTFEYEPHEYNFYEVPIYEHQNLNLYSTSGSEAINSLYNNEGQEINYSGTMGAWEVGPCADYDDFENVIVSVKKWRRNMASNYPEPIELLSETNIIPGFYNQTVSQNFSGVLAPDEMLTATVSMDLDQGCQTSSDVPHCFVNLDIHSNVAGNTNTVSESQPAGLRVVSIVSSPGANNSSDFSIKEYVYHQGKSMSPTFREIDELKNEYCIKSVLNALGEVTGYQDIHCSYLQKTKYSTSYYPPSANASGKYIGYDRVEEIIYNHNKSKQNGKIVREFINTPDIGFTNFLDNPNNAYFSRLFPLQKSYPENGSLLKEKFYSKDDELLNESEYTYTSDDNFCMYGRRSFYHDSYTVAVSGGMPIEAKIYAVSFYPIKSKNTLLSSKTEKTYYSNNAVTVSENYLYDEYQQIKKHTSVVSDGDIVETNYKYPYDLMSQESYPYYSMVNSNVLMPVVEKEVKVNDERITLQRFHHKQWDSNNFRSFPLTKSSNLKGTNTELQEMTAYHKYDNDHNLIEYSQRDGMRTCIVWGYNGTLPIAKIDNASYADFTTAQNNSIASAIAASNADLSPSTEAILYQELQNLRDIIPASQIHTFTYDPLIGITSMTDVKGYTMYYEYDDSNRLRNIRDSDNNILSTNEYNYKNND